MDNEYDITNTSNMVVRATPVCNTSIQQLVYCAADARLGSFLYISGKEWPHTVTSDDHKLVEVFIQSALRDDMSLLVLGLEHVTVLVSE